MKILCLLGTLLVVAVVIGCGGSKAPPQEPEYSGPPIGDTFTFEPSMVTNASAIEEMGVFFVKVTLTPEAEKKYVEFTHANLEKTVKIVLNGEVIAAYGIPGKHPGGPVTIMAPWSKAQADAIVAKLKS